MSLVDIERSGFRNSIVDLTKTSPLGLSELCDFLFTSAVYPSESLAAVREMDEQFIAEFWNDTVRRYGRLSSRENSSSALALLYFYSRDYVGPVRSLFSLSLAEEFQTQGAGIHFLARDGLPEYMAAKVYRDSGIEYPPFNYVPISVRLMRQSLQDTSADLVKTYLNGYGFSDQSTHVLVDIGFTGEIPDLLTKLYPGKNFIVRFLISKGDGVINKARPVMASARGFLYDPSNNDPIWERLLENVRVIRGLEDTWGGVLSSATQLYRSDNGGVSVNSHEYLDSYDVARRRIAMWGIRDSANIFVEALRNGQTVETLLGFKDTYFKKLQELLLNYSKTNIQFGLFVPHEPTN